jgi:hypothetical protein
MFASLSLKVNKLIVFGWFSNRKSFQHRSRLVKGEIMLQQSPKTLPEVEV